jgi:hypothetical protein
MTCAGQTSDTGQTGGQCRSGRWLKQPHNKCYREPQWLLSALEQKHPQNTTCTEGKPYTKPSKTTPNRPRTDQQQHNPKTHTRIKQLTRGKSHKAFTPVRPVKSTGQTGVTWAAQDEQNLQVNFPKSYSRSPDSLHESDQDFGDSRNTSRELEGTIWRTREGGEWESIKNLLEGDGVGVLDRQPTKGSTRGRWMWPRRDR